MKKTIFLFFTGLVSFHILYSQSISEEDYYHTCNTDNFRMNKIFYQKFNPAKLDYKLLNAAVFFCTNEQRIKYRKKPLQHAQQLESAAFLHSQKMAELSFFSHQNDFDIKMKDANDRCRLFGVENPKVAENILYFNKLNVSENTYLEIAEEMLSMWKSSKPHWKNILSDESLQLGCGVYFANEGETVAFYGTQNFQFFDNVIVK